MALGGVEHNCIVYYDLIYHSAMVSDDRFAYCEVQATSPTGNVYQIHLGTISCIHSLQNNNEK